MYLAEEGIEWASNHICWQQLMRAVSQILAARARADPDRCVISGLSLSHQGEQGSRRLEDYSCDNRSIEASSSSASECGGGMTEAADKR